MRSAAAQSESSLKVAYVPIETGPDKKLHDMGQKIDQFTQRDLFGKAHYVEVNAAPFTQYSAPVLDEDWNVVKEVLDHGKEDAIAFVIFGRLARFQQKIQTSIRILNINGRKTQKLETVSPLREQRLPAHIASQILKYIESANSIPVESEGIKWISFVTRDIRGNRIRGELFQNKVRLLTFFTMDCPLCQALCGVLTELHQRHE